jgi:hypothetical protein
MRDAGPLPSVAARKAEAGEEGIAPMSDQVSPPVGVPRAGASGIFDVSTEPLPDPPTIPPFAGDLDDDESSLEQRIDAELGNSDPNSDEPPTLDLDEKLVAEAKRIAARKRETHDDDDLEAVSLDEGEAVQISTPAEESGPWAGALSPETAPKFPKRTRRRSLHDEDDDEDDDDLEQPGTSNPFLAAASERPPASRVPYGLIAGVILAAAVAGFAYGLRDSAQRRKAAGTALDVLPTETTKPPTPPEPEPPGAEPTETKLEQLLREGIEPEQVETLVAEAEREYELGRPDLAQAGVDKVLEAEPQHARALVLRASILIESEQLDGALEAAQASVSADPKFAEGHLAVGVIRQERGELDEAAVAYRRYLRLAPKGLYARSIRRQLERLEGQ